MMRALLFLLALSACAPAHPPRCDMSSERTLAFSAPEASDVLVARAEGPSCDKAIVVLSLRSEEGYPLWTWATTLSHAFGDVFAPGDREAVQDFLNRWIEVDLSTTTQAPPFAMLEDGATTLDQLTYDDIRARDLPMLCHYSGTSAQVCVFWEPAAGGAGHLFDRAVTENQE
ncbi:MAG: hypothetical protein JNM59_00950 [Hyphomonadaceae bacterium]|nr:hypothetical protein [Hyphomonadaceae bacterium]